MIVQEHSALVCNSGITTHMRLLIRISNEQQLSSKAELELKPENASELARGLNWVGYRGLIVVHRIHSNGSS